MTGDEVLTTGYHGYMVTDYTRVDPHLGQVTIGTWTPDATFTTIYTSEGSARVPSEVSSPGWVVASFYADRDGPGPTPRELIAVNDAQPQQWIAPELGGWPRGALFDAAALAKGAPVEFTVVVRDRAGREASAHLDIKTARIPGWE